MSKIEILVTGTNRDSVKFVDELVNNNTDWLFTQASTDEEAIERFHQRDFDIIIFISGTNSEEERKLRKIFMIQNPDIIILEQHSDNVGLLTDKINAALDKQRKDKKPSFSFVDDALKNAGLDIFIQ